MPDRFALHRSNPIRIAVIAEDLRLPLDEGIKKASFLLVESLIQKGADVSVFTRYGNPLFHRVFPLPENKLLFGGTFAQDLRAQSPDVLLYLPLSSGTLGAFLRAAMIQRNSLRTPLALVNLQFRKLPSYARFLGLNRFVRIVFTQSQASAGVFQSIGCQTVLLPGGVDHTIFKPVDLQEKHSLRQKYGFQDEDRIVLHVGHCNRDRNVGLLARLAKSGFRAVLIASTSTAIDPELLDELKRSGVNVVTDFIECVQHYYQMADCYLFPVLNATSAIDAPLSVLEAMACNLPVVTTRFGALPSLFPAGSGLYYGNTEEELIRMVERAFEETDCRTSQMAEPYSWDHLADTVLATLQEAG